MTSLPRSRPVRRSSKRAERASGDASTGNHAGAKTTTKKKPTSAKAQAATKAKTTPAAKAATTREPRRTPRPRPAAAEARSVAAGAQAAPAEPRVGQRDEPPPPPKRKVPAAGYAAPSSRGEEHDSAVADLLTTTVQAAHELAQIGVDVGRAAMRSMLDRLPKA